VGLDLGGSRSVSWRADVLQGCDSKWFEGQGRAAGREFIGDLLPIRAGTRIVQNIVAQKLSNVN
jgi:hypothetical protein